MGERQRVVIVGAGAAGSTAAVAVKQGAAIELAGGARLTADAFVLATGADPRPLPAVIDPGAADRVLTMRTVTTACVFVRHSTGGNHTDRGRRPPRQRRRQVPFVVSAPPSPSWIRSTAHSPGTWGTPSPTWVRGEHLRANVDLRTATGITAVGAAGDAALVRLAAGSTVRADVVVASLGSGPGDRLVARQRDPAVGRRAGRSGVRVLDHPGFYAAGDLAALPGPDGTRVRIEHWGAAMAQGHSAAASVLADLGRAVRHDGEPSVDPRHQTHDRRLGEWRGHRDGCARRGRRAAVHCRAARRRAPDRRCRRRRRSPCCQSAVRPHHAACRHR